VFASLLPLPDSWVCSTEIGKKESSGSAETFTAPLVQEPAIHVEEISRLEKKIEISPPFELQVPETV
jgi:hypothetical protein